MKKLKKLLRMNKKKKTLLVSYLIIFIILMTSFHSTNVKSDDYSTYLYQYDITLDYDYANLMEQSASFGNEYRNYFFSGTEFPYDIGLSEWIGLSGSSRYNYVVSQTYLDNLDDNRAFKQQETLIDNYDYSISNYNINNGIYNEFETNHSLGLLPNQDIFKQWTGYNYDDSNDINLHYTLLDEYISDDSNSGIEVDNTGDSFVEIYELENNNFTHNPYMIRVYVFALRTWSGISNDMKISLNYSGSWEIDKVINTGTSFAWNYIDFENTFINQTELNNMELKIIAPSSITSYEVLVSSIYVKVFCNGSYFSENLELDDTEYSNIDSNSTIINVNPYDYNLYSVPLNTSFNINNGTHYSNGSLYEIDNDYAIFNSTIFFDDGYYYGSPDTFNNESIGDKASLDEIDWIDDKNLHDGEAEIISKWKNHNNVLQLLDDITPGQDPSITHNIPVQSTNGIIEFWFGAPDTNKRYHLVFSDNTSGSIIWFKIESDIIYSRNGGWNSLQSISDNTWYHVKIAWRIDNTYDVYIDDILKLDNQATYTNMNDGINSFTIVSYYDSTDLFYFDGWGNVNDVNYNEGANLFSNIIKPILNFTTDFEYNDNKYFGLDNLTNIRLYYSYKTNISADISLNIWNNDLKVFDLVNISNNYDGFYNNYFVLNSSYYNSSNIIRLNFYGNSTDNFNLLIDKLSLNTTFESINNYNNDIDIILESNILNVNLLELYEFVFTLIYQSNITINIEVYIYDFTVLNWFLINNDTVSSMKTLEYSTAFINNVLSSNNCSLFRFHISRNTTQNINFQLILDYFEIEMKTSVQLYNAIHYIYISYYCYTSGGTLRGRIDLIVEVHKEYVIYDTYTKTWTGSGWLGIANQQEYNLNDTSIDIESMEIQYHIRYGSGLDGNTKINVQFNAILNYNLSIVTNEIREFELTGIWSDIEMFQFTDFSYHKKAFDLSNEGFFNDSNNNKRAFNCLRGVRVLRSDTTKEYNRFFVIPYFFDDVDVGVGIEGSTGSGSGSEPEYPSSEYWTYETFRFTYYTSVEINIGNWTVDYQMSQSETYEAKYFYKSKSIDEDDLGSWKFKITDDIKISFNFLRNGITALINTLLWFVQYIMYLVVASLSYIFMYLGTNILVFLWNYLVFYIFQALIYILWYLFEGLIILLTYIWEGLIWVWENLLLPFFYWFWEYGIPLIIDWLIIILAHVITIVIWLITLGQSDYDAIYDNVYTMLRYIADEIIQMIITFLNNFEYIILFILYYLLLTGLVYVRYLYCKARGFNKRAEQLKDAFDVFVIPIQLTLYLFKTTKDLVDPYTS